MRRKEAMLHLHPHFPTEKEIISVRVHIFARNTQ